MRFLQFLQENRTELYVQTLEHISLTLLSLVLAVLLAVPLGIWITRQPRWAGLMLTITGVLQTIPSLALLGFLIPLLGIGFKPAIVTLFLYALLPILRNTYTGIQGVAPAVKEAALGMGMTPRQVLTKVELPLALPFIFAGIRTATVINVGVATLAAYIGAGGLGKYIFGGISLNNSTMILAGALLAAALAIGFDQALAWLHRFSPQRLLRVLLYGGVSLPILIIAFFIIQHSASNLKIGFDPEFGGRADGYPKLAALYNLQLDAKILNAGLLYRAAAEQEVDVIVGYATDGRIKAYHLAVLQDDKNAFPPYHCAPLLRAELATTHPEVTAALHLLADQINDSTMIALNYQVDLQQKKPEDVAKAFLQQLQLWQPDRRRGGKKLIIGSKPFTEQYLLAHLFAQLIDGYTDFDTEVKAGLGGTKVCFDALRAGGIDLYPEYTGTGFLVLLSPSEAEINQLMTDGPALYDYVETIFLEKYDLQWLRPLGFNNTYALMVQQALADQQNIKTISDLARLKR